MWRLVAERNYELEETAVAFLNRLKPVIYQSGI
jgi:hypothetical protein